MPTSPKAGTRAIAVSICGARRSRSSWNSSYSAFVRRPVDIAGGRARLVRPEQQPAILLAHVPGRIGLAQHAHLGQAAALALTDRRVRLGDDILVLDRDDRDVEAEHRAGLAHEIAGRGDDVLAGDVALVGLDQPLAGRLLLDAR